MEKIKGISLLDDILLGRCLYFKQPDLKSEATKACNVSAELKKLQQALKSASQQLKSAYKSNLESIGLENAMIFRAQEMILNDEDFLGKITGTIKLQKCNAEHAVFVASEHFATSLARTKDKYIQARVNDIKEVSTLLVNHMCCKTPNSSAVPWANNILSANLAGPGHEPLIIATSDVFVSDIMAFRQFGIAGFISKNGCVTSHSSILAQSFGIAALVGVGQDLEWLSGKEVILSGEESLAIVAPDKETKTIYLNRQEAKKADASNTRFNKAQTKDGVEMELLVNISSMEELEIANEFGADGVGLFRSEYLFIGKDRPPSEEEQCEVYKQLLKTCQENPVTIRTLDIGFDKVPEYYKDELALPAVFGERGIRFCLKHEDIFRQQLRALLRASVCGNLRITLPMVSSASEVLKTKQIIADLEKELTAQGLPFKLNIPLGVMIETPAAVFEAPQLAKLVDFFSLGTNDLIQLTFAVDRSSKEAKNAVSNSTVLLKVIKLVANVAAKNGKHMSVCGACAGEIDFLGSLVGLGVRCLSVGPRQLIGVKNRLKEITFADELKKINEVIGDDFPVFESD